MSLHFTSDWWDWIEKNLHAGCSKDSMVEAMLKSGFDLEYAKGHIKEVEEGKIKKADKFLAVNHGYSYDLPISYINNKNIISLLDHKVEIGFRLKRPDVVWINNFLSNDECDLLVSQSQNQLSPSTVIDTNNNVGKIHEARTSEGMCFQREETELIKTIEHRISELIHVPIHYGEGIQILHYKVGAEYKPHFDYFPIDDPGANSYMVSGGQRVCTFIMYLNDVEDGGYTIFPKIDLSVMPKKGSAIYFSYLNSLDQLDIQTLHGGAPVIKGEKWIATKWMRQREYSRQSS